MLADDEGMDVPAVHLQFLPQELLEPGGVQNGAGANDPLLGEAGEFPGGIGEHVHRVGHNEQDAAEMAGGELVHNLFQDGDVLGDELQPGLAGLLVHPCGDDRQGAAGGVVIGSGGDFHGGPIGHSVAEVHGLPLGLGRIGVQQDQMGEQALLQKPEGNGSAHRATADDGRFAKIKFQGCRSPFNSYRLIVLDLPRPIRPAPGRYRKCSYGRENPP